MPVSRRPLTEEAWLQSRATACVICLGWGDTTSGFFSECFVFPPSVSFFKFSVFTHSFIYHRRYKILVIFSVTKQYASKKLFQRSPPWEANRLCTTQGMHRPVQRANTNDVFRGFHYWTVFRAGKIQWNNSSPSYLRHILISPSHYS
jgi:hypothetical protein